VFSCKTAAIALLSKLDNDLRLLLLLLLHLLCAQ
jgi:hypothetical protein